MLPIYGLLGFGYPNLSCFRWFIFSFSHDDNKFYHTTDFFVLNATNSNTYKKCSKFMNSKLPNWPTSAQITKFVTFLFLKWLWLRLCRLGGCYKKCVIRWGTVIKESTYPFTTLNLLLLSCCAYFKLQNKCKFWYKHRLNKYL